jgi:XTP/dITP diphosphohydrolase
MKKIKMVFASSNEGKIKEMNYLINRGLTGYEAELLSLKDVGFTEEIIENGETFEANAEIKARTVFDKTGMICFGDDSGLCVDYLNGAPGIYSARYSGGDSSDNIRKLLGELNGVSDDKRTAHFYCVIYCVTAKNTSFCVSGKCEGVITREIIGDNGFGYDPVFYYPQKNKTFAQMSDGEKNKISHRALAVEQFAEKIVKYNI